MRVARIDHVQLAMPPGGEPLARVFYGGVLGLAEVPKPPVLAARGGCWFENDDVKIHLGVEADFRPALKAHPAFVVENLPELKATLTGASVAYRVDDELEGFDRVFIADPFGNRIELMEPITDTIA
jgi:catechol 2,3-dioxygenase-like lactoylglutathione lyase family enzyme